MRYSLFLFLSLLSITFSFSQANKDLTQLSYSAITDSMIKYGNKKNYTKILELSEVYIKKARQSGDRKNEWLGMSTAAQVLYEEKKYDEAFKNFKKLLEFAQKHNLPECEIQAYNFAGNISMVNANMVEAVKYYNLSLQLSEKQENQLYIQQALINLSTVYSVNEDYRKVLEILKKTVFVFGEKPVDSSYTAQIKSQTLSGLHSRISKMFLNLKEIDSAKYHSQLIRNFNKDKDSCFLKTYYISQFYINLELKKYKESKKNLADAEKYCPQFEGNLAPLRSAYRYGILASGEKDYEAAQKVLVQGLMDYKVSPAEEGFMKDYYKVLAEAFTNTGNFEKASYYFEKFLNSEHVHSKMSDDISNVLIEKERSQFKQEFANLEAEKKKKEINFNYLLLGGSVIILILLFFLLKFYRNKKANEVKFEALLAKIKDAQSPENIIDTKDEILEEISNNDVSEEVKSQILEGLKKLEKQEYFLKQDCNSYNVAKKINTNTSYLSKVINSHYGKNFNTYINDLRINYAIVRLKNDVIFRSYSIQSIAEEIGYKSADSFTKYFKKDTGLNPSFYIKEIKNIT